MQPLDRVTPPPRQAEIGLGHVDLDRCRQEYVVDQSGRILPEGYRLTVSAHGDGSFRVEAADVAGRFYAEQTLAALAGAPCARHHRCVPEADIVDWPEMGMRATIEGFYGPPWTHEDRLEHLRFSARHKLNGYIYAPKNDAYHRDRWRDPYPSAELGRMAELVAEANAQHVQLVFAVSPGLSMVYSDPEEHAALHAKAEQMWEVGVRRFALLFDDIPPDLVHERDRVMFGTTPGSSAAAHAAVCARFAEGFLATHGAEPSRSCPLLMVPTDYAGNQSSPYRDQLRNLLPVHTVVWWTGPDIVVGKISEADVAAAHASYGQRLALWDNFPVNDFDPGRLFLGPLVDRPRSHDPLTLAGITANPMVQPAASQIALSTVAEYAWNPAGYDPAHAHERALGLLLADEPGLRPLVDACSTWPPSADESPRLSALCSAALSGGVSEAEALARALRPLAELPEAGKGRLAVEVHGWVVAARAMARAGLAAAELLQPARPRGAGGSGDAADRARALLDEAESHDAKVLRTVLPAFVSAALCRGQRAST